MNVFPPIENEIDGSSSILLQLICVETRNIESESFKSKISSYIVLASNNRHASNECVQSLYFGNRSSYERSASVGNHLTPILAKSPFCFIRNLNAVKKIIIKLIKPSFLLNNLPIDFELPICLPSNRYPRNISRVQGGIQPTKCDFASPIRLRIAN